MPHTRRSFLKLAGAATVAAAAVPRDAGAAQASQTPRKRNGNGGQMPKNLTLCTLRNGDRFTLGVRTKKGVLDVEKAAKALRKTAPTTMEDLLQGGDGKALEALVEAATANGGAKAAFIAEEKVPFGPCVTNPEKIIMLGFNYKKHVEEVKTKMPTSPVFFNKYNNSLNHHGGVINLPQKVATKFDYEVELVVVMGKTAREVSEADALNYVFGYATGNDFTARDLQFKTSQYVLGKSLDGFGPLGPWLVTADQIPDPQNLKLECSVNGQVRQSANTNDMIFSVANIVSYASQHFTLKPGDIFFTGTPSGVIFGMPPEKQVWLKPGDQIACSIEKCGELRFSLAGSQA
jgi:2-keto-4-pentenoate hydratase/2-oxohepta-3-ene-1,7-dioic acid hydratase in catechol pathway